MTRREFTRSQRAAIVHRSMNERGQVCCEGCHLVLGHKPWHIDHTIPEALFLDKSRPLTIKDGKLLGVDCCHDPKTAQDVAVIAKAVRREARRLGIRKPSGFRKPPEGYKFSWRTGRMEKTT